MQDNYRGRVSDLLPQARGFESFAPLGDGNKTGIPQSPVADIFFSARNIEALQHGIRYSVYKRTGKVIGNQSEQELQTIMRSVYFQHSEHRANDKIGQVRELNGHVLDYAVDTVVSETQMRQSYLRDISQLPTPLPRSINTSMRGTKVLEMSDL